MIGLRRVVPVPPRCATAGWSGSARARGAAAGWSGSARVRCAAAGWSGSARAGATLTEVLMALLVMGVGAVSVFTLFPISVLRAIQATQQTNSKILKLNAEELIYSSPSVFLFGGVPNYRDQWQAGQTYAVNDIVVPSIKPGAALPQPFFWYLCTNAAAPPPNNTSGLVEPVWPTTLAAPTVVDNGVTWSLQLIPANLGATNAHGYVIDPLGWYETQAENPGSEVEFGSKTNRVTAVVTSAGPAPLLRTNGGLSASEAPANAFLLDSWSEVTSGTPTAATANSVTFPPSISLAGIAGTLRVVLTSTDGRTTFTRSIPAGGIAGQTVTWSAVQPFPARFPLAGAPPAPDIGLVRVEQFDRRYSWFLTVRKSLTGPPEMKCVVVFKRSFNSTEEQAYDANFSNGAIDLDADGTDDATQHVLGTRADWVKIIWDPATDPEPLLKPGNFLFDGRDVSWYRIQEVYDRGTSGANEFAVLILDRSVESLTPPGAGTPPPPNPPGRAILMRGIIDVYDL